VKKKSAYFGLSIAITLLSIVTWFVPIKTFGQGKTQPRLEGFNIKEIRFDESTGEKLPVPIIPKDWKLISVSNGERSNSSSLWFQDTTGNIYLVQGFITAGQFIISERIQKLAVK
jgi:hypothetical protein